MNRRIPGMFGLGVAVLPACGIEIKVSDTGAGTMGTDTISTGTPSTTGDGFSVTTTWTEGGACGDSVRIQIVDPLGVQEWDLGMHRDDYTAENCSSGVGTCHPIRVDHTLHQVADCLAGSVVPGSTTYFDASTQPETYYLSDRTGSCFLWGTDVAYYAALGCAELI